MIRDPFKSIIAIIAPRIVSHLSRETNYFGKAKTLSTPPSWV